MPYIQENKVTSYWDGKKVGKKSHPRFSITIPRKIIDTMGWKKGDELKFELEGKKVFLKKEVK